MADTVIFTIEVTVEEYRKLCEMVELENVASINEVYRIALNRNYRFLQSIKHMGESINQILSDNSAKNKN